MPYKAEYIWIDGTEPTAKLRSKTKIVPDGAELPIWGFDGSSTNQAPGSNSDCVLQPVASYADPIRGGDDVIVMAEGRLLAHGAPGAVMKNEAVIEAYLGRGLKNRPARAGAPK